MESSLVKIRREIYVRIAEAFFENKLNEKIDRIPLEMRPKNGSELSRCCIYKDREMIKYRIMAALGLGVEDEEDELTPLSEYAKEALNSHVKDSYLTIFSDLCSACIKTHYHVTDGCRGCVARPCTTSCAKEAISFINGKAIINSDSCVGCGKCMTVCPYRSIIRVPIPCEESCPTGAITKDQSGKEEIDDNKCILCGKCLQACPFGAIAERSQLIKVLQALSEGEPVVALIAPSIAGQFSGSMEQLHSALMKLGFSSVLEVAHGAEQTAIEETNEFQERMVNGQQFMTSSCCSAYVLAVNKHIVKLQPYVSNTPSPMIFAGRNAREKYPTAKTVFIGPCLAKRSEAFNSGYIDYTLTFVELDSLFISKGINVGECEAVELMKPATKESLLFAVSGGVAGAVGYCINPNINFRPYIVNGYNRRELKQLPGKLINQKPGNFIEVMTCEGGCIAGPGTIVNSNNAARSVERLAEKADSIFKAEIG
ncbi:MAG: monomeric [FeFe] hydrogenase [Bacteroidota bacterium]|nr:monomeric [FeFe] hydrogenase [Bacteroidota bacterium]MDP4190492.1 monomeric [FeFe] hydrogenase [Bacteroidota bacterium]MDP4194784.1 monomeric [FeFe] hydrogenase [Bacteroidota bacterium]